MQNVERQANEWFGDYMCDSSHKGWMSPRRYASARRYGHTNKRDRAAFGRSMVRSVRRAGAFPGHNIYS